MAPKINALHILLLEGKHVIKRQLYGGQTIHLERSRFTYPLALMVKTQCTASLPVLVRLRLNKLQLLPSESEVVCHENYLQLLTRSGWQSLLTESSVWYFWYTLIPSFTVSSLISITSCSPFSLPRRRLPPARRRSYETKRERYVRKQLPRENTVGIYHIVNETECLLFSLIPRSDSVCIFPSIHPVLSLGPRLAYASTEKLNGAVLVVSHQSQDQQPLLIKAGQGQYLVPIIYINS